MIDSVRKYSIELQKQIELDRKSEKKKFLNIKRQTTNSDNVCINFNAIEEFIYFRGVIII
jgi:hypothetical protein